jgi:hypothetical protein
LIATLGVGLIARTVFQQLSKLGGVPGWILSASIAAATTVTIGYAAVLWFAYGEQPTREMLQAITVVVARAVRDQLMSLGERRPDRVAVRERIGEALTDIPERLRPGSGRPTSPDEDQPGLETEPSSS